VIVERCWVGASSKVSFTFTWGVWGTCKFGN
jgi:hypothetical protein